MKIKFVALALLLLASACLAGCAKPFEPADLEIKPVQGTIIPRYAPAAVVLECQEFELVDGKEVPHGTTGMVAISKAEGELLRWTLGLTRRSKNTGIYFAATTDQLGTIKSVELTNKLDDPTNMMIIGIVGRSLFVDYITPLAQKPITNGEVIAPTAPIITSFAKGLDKVNASAILRGETTYNGIPCYVAAYKITSQKYMTKEQDMAHAEFTSLMLLDKETMVPVVGKQTVSVIYENSQKSPKGFIRRISSDR